MIAFLCLLLLRTLDLASRVCAYSSVCVCAPVPDEKEELPIVLLEEPMYARRSLNDFRVLLDMRCDT
jgi:hypothetical protein